MTPTFFTDKTHDPVNRRLLARKIIIKLSVVNNGRNDVQPTEDSSEESRASIMESIIPEIHLPDV